VPSSAIGETDVTTGWQFRVDRGGTFTDIAARRPDGRLSGPADGIVGMARMSQLAGFNGVIGSDMGGTSTDVSHFADEYERVFTTQIAGVRLRAPMPDIHTVAADGGSVLHFDGSRYRVGPDSASADPGPACYGSGGPPAVTDANGMLGRIQPAHSPEMFGPDGDQPLDDAGHDVTPRGPGVATARARARGAAPRPPDRRPHRRPRRVRRTARQRRRRTVARRGRLGAEHPLPRADDRLHAVAAPEGCAVRYGGRRSRRAGANRVQRVDGTVTELAGSDTADVGPGCVLVIETPGGGGYGPPSPDPHQAGEEIDDLRAF
jgi:hypothetical protein